MLDGRLAMTSLSSDARTLILRPLLVNANADGHRQFAAAAVEASQADIASCRCRI